VTAVHAGEALLDLQLADVLAPSEGVHDDQVRAVHATYQAGPHGVHVSEHGGVVAFVHELGAPEFPSTTVDAAVGVGLRCSRDSRNSGVQAGNLLTAVAGAVAVDTASDQV